MTVERTFVIPNQLGLHARAATRFVQTTGRFRAEVQVEKEGVVVNGKSIMGILLLVAPHGTRIVVRASGDDAEDSMRALEDLFAARFGEE
jgi:phosphocarrier protein HPr